jgi:oligopeptide/dipeptide ABC transporter ATP-binding protein
LAEASFVETQNTPLVEARNLTKHFRIPGSSATVQACNDVSFAIGRGETLGLVGESGSGKTTAGRCLVRLVEIDGGEVYFRGQRIDDMPQKAFRQYRKYMQIVFQEPFESLNPLMSGEATIEESLRTHTDLDGQARRRRVRELLEMVGLLPAYAEARPHEISAGAQQRLAIARALAPGPSFMVLDEPTSALPPDAKPGIMRLLRDLQRELKLGYLFISHDLSLVNEFCDRVAVMYLSQIVEEGTRRDVLATPAHPYSRALLSSVLLPDPKRKRLIAQDAVRLEGEIPSPIDLPHGCYLQSRCPFAVAGCDWPQRLVGVPRKPRQLARCWRVGAGELEHVDLADLYGSV